ncbi:hypothetical protein GQ457_11G006350 [Hibiscus cannabinus]
MASSALVSKLEVNVEIKASPDRFHDMITNKPDHVHRASYDKVQGCDLHQGEWGKVGSIIIWDYVLDGKAGVAKEVIEAMDPDKNLIALRIIEGDLLEKYKSFVATIQASAKSDGSGSVVQWTLEYEKLHEGIEHPQSLLQLAVDLSKDIDAHLTAQPN